MHTLLYSVPLTLKQATADPHLCWRFQDTMGMSGSVSCGVTSPFSWVLEQTRFCLCPPRVYFPSPVSVLAALWWGHCSFLLGPGVHKDLFVPPKSLFPLACVRIPLVSKVKFPGGSQSLYQIPRLGNLFWVLELNSARICLV